MKFQSQIPRDTKSIQKSKNVTKKQVKLTN
jgi:hypothetical protein